MVETRPIKITDRTLDDVFSRFLCVLFTITLRKKSNGVARIVGVEKNIERACVTPLASASGLL